MLQKCAKLPFIDDKFNEFCNEYKKTDTMTQEDLVSQFVEWMKSHCQEQLVIDICIELNDYHQFLSYKYFVTKNLPWISPQISFRNWIQHPRHPCPIITISDDGCRINNFEQINNWNVNTESMIRDIVECIDFENLIAINVYQCDKVILFQQLCDKFVLGKTSIKTNDFCKIKSHNTWTLIKLLTELQNIKTLTCFFMQYQIKYELDKQLNFYLLLQVSSVNQKLATKNGIPGKTIRTGTKIKVQLMINDKEWQNSNFKRQLIHYYLSYYIIKQFVYNEYLIGKMHYYYQYKMQQMADKQYCNIKYAYIDYQSNKRIPSIETYYKEFAHSNDHETLFKYFSTKTGTKYISSNCNPHSSHIFWTGISIYENVVSTKWKNIMYREVNKWTTNTTTLPDCVCRDPSEYRHKYYIFYRYMWRKNNKISTKQLNKQLSIAGGLRPIKMSYNNNLQWIMDLIDHLKNTGFIKKSDKINQIGINHYFNPFTEKKVIYNGIDPHLEYDKFSVVYSISIYGQNTKPSSLSFNLHSNKSCGDCKILMPDKVGLKLDS